MKNTEAKGDLKYVELTGMITRLFSNMESNLEAKTDAIKILINQPEQHHKNSGHVTNQATQEAKKVHGRDENTSKNKSPTTSPTKKKSKESSPVEEKDSNETMEIDKNIENRTLTDNDEEDLNPKASRMSTDNDNNKMSIDGHYDEEDNSNSEFRMTPRRRGRTSRTSISPSIQSPPKVEHHTNPFAALSEGMQNV